MFKDTRSNRILVRAVILFFQWIGPLCTGYTAYCAIHYWPEAPKLTAWRFYCALEAGWYVFMIWYKRHLQKIAKHPPKCSPEERQALFNKVRSEIHDPEKFLSGWFRGWDVQEIGREELRTFLSWAFWNGEAGEKDRAEMDQYVHQLEAMIGKPFREGHGKAKSLRLSTDPIEMEARSLLWYSLIMMADSLTFFLFRKNGFQYHRTSMTSLSIFPPRPLAITATDTSISKRISYWLRPHTSKTRLPILYIHGIGIGLIAQVEFLHQLDQTLNSGREPDDQVGILAVEVLQVSSRLTHSVLRRDEVRAEIRSILDYYGWNRFILACHSYGSIVSSHIFSDDHLTSRISSVLMVDPVTLLLHMPDVAYNFTVRPPIRAMEWALWYFASTDPGVAYSLGRHLFWSETVLWRDRVLELMREKKIRFTLSLASDDLIVDTNAVGRYVTAGVRPDPHLQHDISGQDRMELLAPTHDETWKTEKWKGIGLDVIWWQDYDHAECFDSAQDRSRLVDVLVEYSNGV